MKRSEQLLTRERSILVVIDMQETFLRPIFERERVERNVGFLLQAARILQVPVLATEQYTTRMGNTIPSLAALFPEGLEVVDKLCFSGCGADAFARQLQAAQRSQVLLVGIEAHICLMQTSHDLIAAGYQVHVPWDAISSRAEGDWRYALERMKASGIVITSTESALYEWLYQAGTDEFKQVLPLIKERDKK